MKEFNFKKKYGQNFLQNEAIIDKIIDSIDPTEEDLIIEIGPGPGTLTKKLKKYNSHLVAFEIDQDTKQYLLPLEDEKCHIIFKDFMTVDLLDELKDIQYKNIYIIGNLPYYITTPIIERIIDANVDPDEMVFMVQKEVADRFTANPKTKEYGYMTVLLNYHFEISKVIDVGRKNFYPVPNVDSTVIKFIEKEKKKIDYNKFKNLLKDSFQFKRKTILNNLRNYDTDKLNIILKNHNYTLQTRAEEIDLETFIDLSEQL